MRTLATVLTLLALAVAAGALETSAPMNSANPKPSAGNTQLATLGGGCFWCLEAVFEMVDGVKSVVSGYAGGQTENPTYKEVCGGKTGHAEVVQIEFDPAKVTYERLLELFWQCHDPTTLNRQGADEGTQYRSVIFYHDDRQRQAAEKSKQAAQAEFAAPIVTEIAKLPPFYVAEAYHQDYFRNHPTQGYCRAVIAPKVDKMKQKLTSPH